jgi:hypothetical protein
MFALGLCVQNYRDMVFSLDYPLSECQNCVLCALYPLSFARILLDAMVSGILQKCPPRVSRAEARSVSPLPTVINVNSLPTVSSLLPTRTDFRRTRPPSWINALPDSRPQTTMYSISRVTPMWLPWYLDAQCILAVSENFPWHVTDSVNRSVR